MKINTKTILLIVSVLLSLALKSGDMIELKSFLNARSSATFLKSSNNIITVLKKGTTGEILESKKMPSGNYGLKIKIDSGPMAAQTYWVYYNVQKPAIELQNKQHKRLPAPQIQEAHRAHLSKDQWGIRERNESVLLEAAQTANKVLNTDSKPLTGESRDNTRCRYFNPEVIESINEADYNETSLVEPFRERATSALQSKSCRSHASGYDVCRNSKDQIESFQLTNSGPNAIVKSNEYFINRTLNFEFEDRARSDMKLVIADSPDETTSHATYSAMLFLPRKVLPSIKKAGNVLEVTLPTKEVVKFNATTKEIIGGALSEGPMQQDERKKARPANIKYLGDGVLIRADKSGDLPYGDIELKDGTHAPSISMATVSKRGHKDCKIPAKDIWYTDYEKGANVFVKPELVTDQGMNNFILKKCGFSIN